MKKWIFSLVLGFSLVAVPAHAQEFIVKLKENVTASNFLAANALKQSAVRVIGNDKFFVIEGTYAEIMSNPAVKYAEPNTRIQIAPIKTSEEDSAKKNWGLEKISAPAAWAKGFTGKGIKIAVIDTGIDYNHPELAAAMKPKTDAVMADCTGWDFANKDNDPMDDQSHGTHVSGTIAGKTVGVAPDATLMGVKFLDGNGSGTLEDALLAIQYAIDCKVDVMSNSWGGGGRMQSMQDQINDAYSKGILFVAAAGNSYGDNDARPSYPANYDNVISVAASDKDDKKAAFSNYGEKTVHVLAPGKDIYSSVPEGKYDTYSGTSMATPHVSGVIALMLQAGQAKVAIKDKLIASYDEIATPVKVVSKGRLNALKSVE